MAKAQFYGAGFPYLNVKKLPGKLIAIEGTDGVGRSTQVDLLRKWLEKNGYAVSDTGLRRSPLTQPGLDQARKGNTLTPLTISLFYATDFADRLENQIIPALKAGFYVLSDRYFYSIIARDIVRGINPQWARNLYGFALVPDVVLYLKAEVETLVTRIVHGRGFDYWEAGMDIIKADNLYDSFVQYQTCMIDQFDQMAKEYKFHVIDANQSVKEINSDIREHLQKILE
ncbi:MAG: thymidylate kinase [Anaerolineaceae bacterium]|jgi:dTMP kinase|nr:thymidylate kinase [Anaerolineaceae bacterium]